MSRRGLFGLLGAGLIAGSALVAGCGSEKRRVVEHHEQSLEKGSFSYDIFLKQNNANHVRNGANDLEKTYRVEVRSKDSSNGSIFAKYLVNMKSLPGENGPGMNLSDITLIELYKKGELITKYDQVSLMQKWGSGKTSNYSGQELIEHSGDIGRIWRDYFAGDINWVILPHVNKCKGEAPCWKK